ncbi:MAG: hypothetical protein K2Q32_03670 [Alphaproteobacteria bacterium]|nr:hypothetical protein [Alphaproteobacteria bacterium]
MTNIPQNNSLFDGETFKGELKTHFDKLCLSGDFQRLIRNVAATHFDIPADIFKGRLTHLDGRMTVKGNIDATLAQQTLIYVFKTFLEKNGRDNDAKIIGRKLGRTHTAITKAIDTVTEKLAKEATQGQTELKDNITVLTLKIIMRVMETSPNGRRLQQDAQGTDTPNRPQPAAPLVTVDTANVARKG